MTIICTSLKGELLIWDKTEFIKKVASSTAILNSTIAKSKDKSCLYDIQAFDVINIYYEQKKRLRQPDCELHPKKMNQLSHTVTFQQIREEKLGNDAIEKS